MGDRRSGKAASPNVRALSSQDDAEELSAWLDELRTLGAQYREKTSDVVAPYVGLSAINRTSPMANVTPIRHSTAADATSYTPRSMATSDGVSVAETSTRERSRKSLRQTPSPTVVVQSTTATFKPHINETSRKMQTNPAARQKRHDDHVHRHKDCQHESHFMPQIDDRSKELTRDRDAMPAQMRYESMYSLSKTLEQKRQSARENHEEQLQAECTFQPNINSNPYQTVNSPRNSVASVETFVDRSHVNEEHRVQQLEAARVAKQMREEKRLKEECTFSPAINKAPTNTTSTSTSTHDDASLQAYYGRMRDARSQRALEQAAKDLRLEHPELDVAKVKKSPVPFELAPRKTLSPSDENKSHMGDTDSRLNGSGASHHGHSPSHVRAVSRPVAWEPGALHPADTDLSQHEGLKDQFVHKKVICPYCNSETDKYYFSAHGVRADKGVSANIPPDMVETGCQTFSNASGACVLCGRSDIEVQTLRETLKFYINELDKEKRKAPTVVHVPVEVPISVVPPPAPAAPAFDSEGRCNSCHYKAPVTRENEAQTDPPQMSPVLPPRLPTPPPEPTPVPSPAPTPAPAPHEPEAPKPKKNMATHRQMMQDAGKQVAIVLAKVAAAVGDSIRIKAATAAAKDVLNRISQVLKDLRDTVDDEEKKEQIGQLSLNLDDLTLELDKESKMLALEPTNKTVLAQLTVTMKQLEDTVDIAMAKGTSYAVKVDLAEAVAKVPMFDGVSNVGFFNDIVRRMREEVFPPNTYIVRHGEMGTSMYFITKGDVGIRLADGTKVAELHEGGFFGEIALLISGQRTASVLAESYVQAYVLEKADLDSSLAKFPMFKEHFHRVAKQRLQENERKKRRTDMAVRLAKLPVAPYRKHLLDVKADADRVLASPTPDPAGSRPIVEKLTRLLNELQPLVTADKLREQLKTALTNMAPLIATPHMVLGIQIAHAAILQGLHVVAVDEMLEALRDQPLFRDINEGFKTVLLENIQYRQLENNFCVLGAGERPSAIFFVATGSLAIRKITEDKAAGVTGALIGNVEKHELLCDDTFPVPHAHAPQNILELIEEAKGPIQYNYFAAGEAEVVQLNYSVITRAFEMFPQFHGNVEAYANERHSKETNLSKQASGVLKAGDKLKNLVKRKKIPPEEVMALSKFTTVQPRDLDALTKEQLASTQETLRALLDAVTKQLEVASST